MSHLTGADRADQSDLSHEPESPDDPYVPNDADWAEYAQWAAAVDAAGPLAEPEGRDFGHRRQCDRCGDEMRVFRGEWYCPSCTSFIPLGDGRAA